MANMFLTFKDKGDNRVIDGESVDDAEPVHHLGEIEIHDWTWIVQNPAVNQQGQDTGKLSVQNIIIHKHCEHASAAILQHCVKGTSIDKAQITCRKNFGERMFEYLIIDLADVKIHQVEWKGRGDGEVVFEEVTLKFGKFHFGYHQQPNKELDHVPGWVGHGWDIPKNVEWHDSKNPHGIDIKAA